MSHSPPELPSLCHLPSIKPDVDDMMETIEEIKKSLPPDYREHGQIGEARKRAIAILIVLTNLVPVCLPILLSVPC